MKYYLGIDGGGTRTTAAVCDENGEIVLKVIGKTINFYSVGLESSRNNLDEIIKDIINILGNICFEAAFVGCSALDGEADNETVSALCGGIINSRKTKMNSDVYVALKSVEAQACHCVAVCGTGSMAIGENANGKIVVKGGWGHIIGDEGSAYSIAVNALKRCCELSDEGVTNTLTKSAVDYFGVSDFRKAIDIIYSCDTTKDIIAGFAAYVGKNAENADADSERIIISEAKSFSKTVICLLNELDDCSLLSLYGGVFQHNTLFRNTFSDEIKAVNPDIRISLLDVPPEEGALRIARKMQ
ncbi:MAG: hypothetical protein IJB45_06790 [Clostridia bacterium]|nr:hypothetical protein [Clostridia bacterium]